MFVRYLLVAIIVVLVAILVVKAFSGNAIATTDVYNTVTATPVSVPASVLRDETTATPVSTPASVIRETTATPVSMPAPVLRDETTASNVSITAIKVKSSETSQKSIIQDGTGIKQMMVLASALSKLDYEEVVIDVWDGVALLANSKGVVGEIYGRETVGYRRNAKVVEESVVKAFFTNDGELFADNAREGDAHQTAELSSYNLNKVRFVQIEGEDFYRLVVIGTPTTVKGSTGSSGNAASQEPSSEKITTPEPELRPSEDFVAATPNPTLRPRDDVVDTGVAMPNPSLRANEETLETSAPAPSLSNSADTASMPAPSLRGLDFD